MSEITNYQQAPNMPVPQNVPMGNINQGTIAIESQRAIAEAQAKLLVAQRFPRDEIAAYNRMYRACQRKSFAEKAFFNFPRAGGSVSGPTIRLAEISIHAPLAGCDTPPSWRSTTPSDFNPRTPCGVRRFDAA